MFAARLIQCVICGPLQSLEQMMVPSFVFFVLVLPASSLNLVPPSNLWLAAGQLFAVAAAMASRLREPVSC